MAPIGGTTNAWKLGTRQIVSMAIGAGLYAVVGGATAALRIPGPFGLTIRPAIVIPVFFGAIFGPWVGFFTGLVGDILINLLAGIGLIWNWSLSNGLLGLISGFAYIRARRDELPSLRSVLTWATIGTILAFFFSSMTDMLYGLTLTLALTEWIQVVIIDLIPIIILMPILYVAYRQVQERSGQ